MQINRLDNSSVAANVLKSTTNQCQCKAESCINVLKQHWADEHKNVMSELEKCSDDEWLVVGPTDGQPQAWFVGLMENCCGRLGLLQSGLGFDTSSFAVAQVLRLQWFFLLAAAELVDDFHRECLVPAVFVDLRLFQLNCFVLCRTFLLWIVFRFVPQPANTELLLDYFKTSQKLQRVVQWQS